MSERNDRRSAGRADRTTEHDAVIERLRSALEEVAMGAELGTGPGVVDVRPAGSVTVAGRTTVDAPAASEEPDAPTIAIGATASTSGHDRSGRHRTGTILGVAAACAALIGGATWALSQRSPSPVDEGAPAPDVTVEEPPMTTILGAGDPWFTLASANLVPGAISRPERFPADNEPLFQSWRVVGDGLDGFLFATITADRAIERPEVGDASTVDELAGVPEGRAWLVFPPSDADAFAAPSLWWSRADGSLWVFDEQGLYSAVSSNIWIDLVLGSEQGSGVPIVLPSANATVISVGITSTVVITQQYTGTTAGTVDLTVTDGAAAPSALAQAVTVEPVTVADREGWKGTYGDGHVEVVWNVGGGWWGLLGISTELAEQADGIIAAVAPTGDAVIPATPVAPPP